MSGQVSTPAEGSDAPAAPATDGGGDFEAALKAAVDEAPGDVPEGDDTPAEGAPEGAEPAETPEGEPKKDEPEQDAKPKAKDDKPEPQKLREAIEAEVRTKLRGEFTALARDRGKLKEREAAAAAVETRAKSYEQKAAGFDQLVTRLRNGDATVLREIAPDSSDEVINKLLDGIVASEKSPAERDVERLRNELKARDDRAAVAEQQRVVDQWRATVRGQVEASEAYDLVNSLGQHDAVIATIEAYYVKYGGAILPVEDAAQAVEDTLAKGLAKSKKFGARAPATNAQPSKGTPAPSATKGGARTLSSVPSSELPPGGGDDLPLDPQERFKAVMRGI